MELAESRQLSWMWKCELSLELMKAITDPPVLFVGDVGVFADNLLASKLFRFSTVSGPVKGNLWAEVWVL